MSVDFTKKRRRFLKWFAIWLVVFGGPQVYKFFVLDGSSLANDWRALVYPLILVLVFSIPVGLIMSAIEGKHFSKLEKENESKS